MYIYTLLFSYRKTLVALWLSSSTIYSSTHYLNPGFLSSTVNNPSRPLVLSGGSCSESCRHTPRSYFPFTTSAHRGHNVSDDSAVYFQQRGHFSLVVGMTITLYEDSSRISPPVEEKHVKSLPDRPLNLCISVFLQVPPERASSLPWEILLPLHKQPRWWAHTIWWLQGEEESETLRGWFFHRSWSSVSTQAEHACLLFICVQFW